MSDHAQLSRFDLPGLNLPLNWVPNVPASTVVGESVTKTSPHEFKRGEARNLLKTALNESDMTDGTTYLPLLTLREITMLHIMNALTDKPGWEEKVFDEVISEKWKSEAMDIEGRDVTREMVDWIIEELRWKAADFKVTGMVNVYNGDVVKSDGAIAPDLKQSLKLAVQKLENVPVNNKDYHPGSDGKVLDLVHPSLFPLIYGRSRILEDRIIGLQDCIQSSGTGKVIDARPEIEKKLRVLSPPIGSEPYSNKFQWLPCDVDISDPASAKITSYINNLHPQEHADLYSVIEQIIDKTLPLWARSLGPLAALDFNRRIDYDVEFSKDPDDVDEKDKPQQNDGEDEDDYWDRVQEWEDAYRETKQPELREFEAPVRTHTLDLRDLYHSRGLQVIVKLANIELSPEMPNYDGGTWHVEGQMNEHICGTALYYYDNENITESKLGFRQQSVTKEVEDMYYPQSVYQWVEDVYGCEGNGPAVQNVGSVTCSEGRLLTFTNVLQHQVQPFSLVDKTKPGHRKILALFLVDPEIRVISTANVPPQQREWWAKEVDVQTADQTMGIGGLSWELKNHVFENVEDFPISLEEAKALRLELMEERKHYLTQIGEVFMAHEFSLCEH